MEKNWRVAALRRWLEFLPPLIFLAVLLNLAVLIRGSRGVGSPPAETISRLAGWAVPLFSSAVALGFAVMAIIQMFKPSIRVVFHRRQIALWLEDSKDPAISLDKFLDRISKYRHDALLELPIEQLAAQIQSASEEALALSDRSDCFIQALIGKPEKSEMSNGKSDDSLMKARDQARSSFVVQRRLDALQIQVRYGWRRLLRVLSLAISATLTSVGAIVFALWQQNFVGTAFLVLLLSALGGFFASVARDAVAVVERLRS